MVKNVTQYIVSNFGFQDTTDFMVSLVHKNLILMSIPLAGVSSVVESVFGLQGLTLIAFVTLVTLELLTGLIASKVRGEEIVSNKFGRFGLKVFVWLVLLFVMNALKKEYHDGEQFTDVASGLLTWLHGTLFIYINLEYLISVLENLGTITGKKNDGLIKMVSDRFSGKNK